MDLDTLTNQPRSVELGGKTYKVGQYTFKDLGRLTAYVKSAIPHPIEAIKPLLDGLQPEERMQLIREAKEEAKRYPPTFDSPEVEEVLMNRVEGHMLLLDLAINSRKTYTTEELVAIYKEMTDRGIIKAKVELYNLFLVGFGQTLDVEAILAELEGPKVPAEAGPDGEPSGSTTPQSAPRRRQTTVGPTKK